MTTNDYVAVLEQVPTSVLLKAAKERREAEFKKLGPHATQKVAVKCTGCGSEFGVRELLRHKKECKKFLEGRQKSIAENGGKVKPEWSLGWRGHK